MIRVRILRGTVAGGQVVGVGETHDLPDADALLIVRLGKAVRVDGAPARVDTGVVQAPEVEGAPVVEHREPPARKRR